MAGPAFRFWSSTCGDARTILQVPAPIRLQAGCERRTEETKRQNNFFPSIRVRRRAFLVKKQRSNKGVFLDDPGAESHFNRVTSFRGPLLLSFPRFNQGGRKDNSGCRFRLCVAIVYQEFTSPQKGRRERGRRRLGSKQGYATIATPSGGNGGVSVAAARSVLNG